MGTFWAKLKEVSGGSKNLDPAAAPGALIGVGEDGGTMATALLESVRRVFDGVRQQAAGGDAALLDRYLGCRDEDAFGVIVHRHGPMVLGVCRRVLRDVHAAEDAFQATFLVLAKKAGSVRPPGVLGAWLYGVAYRTA